MNTQNKSVEKFLQSTCKFISTEERAKDIQDELRDHVSSYIEEFTQEGMEYEEATNMALKQMGDPDVLSEIYKSESNKSKRLFKSFLIGITLLLYVGAEIVDTYISNSNVFISASFVIVMTLCYGYFILDLIKTHKKDCELSKKEPIFYIQSYKMPTWYEKMAKYIQYFFMGSIILTLVAFLIDFNEIPNNEILKEVLEIIILSKSYLIMVILFSVLSPKNSNNIVYKDGILTLMSFIPFSNVCGYRWTKEHVKGKVCHTLELKLKKKSKFSNNNAGIKVSSYQINLIEEMFRSRSIEQMRYF